MATKIFGALGRTARARPYLALLLLCLTLFLPGQTSLPPLDRDEARFAQASRQMLETHDFVRIRFQEEPRHKKPAGIHWLQAASTELFSDAPWGEIWTYRVPSVLGAIAAVLMLFAIARPLIGVEGGLVAAGGLAGAILVVAEAHIAKTDAVLLATVVAAQLFLSRIILPERPAMPPGWKTALGFWLAIGGSALIKGPIGPLVVLLTILALLITGKDRSWLKRLHLPWGLPLALAIALPWYIATNAATEGAFVSDAVSQDLLPKLLSAQESHGAPPGTYLLSALISFWPLSLLLPTAVVGGWRERAQPAVRFALCWLVPSWILFEIVPTKLPHYVMPVYPAAALLIGWAVSARPQLWWRRLARGWSWVWTLLFVAFGAALPVAAWFYGDEWPVTAAVAGLAMAVGSIAAGKAVRNHQPMRAVGFGLAGSVGVFLMLGLSVAPRLDNLWLSRSLETAVERIDPEQTRPVVSAGYAEPSLVFMLGTETHLATAEEAAEALAEDPRTLALITERESEDFREALAEDGIKAAIRDTVPGMNYSKGREHEVEIWERLNAIP